MKSLLKILMIFTLLIGLVNYSLIVSAINEVEVSNFNELKKAIDSGGNQVIIIKNDIIFTEQIVLPATSNITIKDDGSLARLILDESMTIEDSRTYGKGLFLVSGGAKLTLAGSKNANLVFDGNRDNINKDMEITDNGVFITIQDNQSQVIIEHASFINSKNRGMKTAPILVKDNGRLVINDVLISNNILNSVSTIANAPFVDWDNRTDTIWSAKGSAIAIQSGAIVEINGGTIEGNGLINQDYFSDANLNSNSPKGNFGTGAITLFGRNTKLIINGGAFRNNYAGFGGVISIFNGSHATINDGLFENNKAIRSGGVIHASSSVYDVETGNQGINNGSIISKININGGTFKNNRAYKNGGGVLFSDWNTLTSITGGIFESNISNHGGAIVINDRWREGVGNNGGSRVYSLATAAGLRNYRQWMWRSKASISGGEFKSNVASIAGGAIYVNSSDFDITKATFDNNSATRFGGAIYLSSVPHVLKLNNAYFENNVATKDLDIENVVWNYYGQTVNLYNGVGGAVWFCPTGNSEVYNSNSAIFVNNKADRGGSDIGSVTKVSSESANNSNDVDIKNKDFTITIGNRMLGGGKISWYVDGSSIGDNIQRYPNNQTLLPNITNQKLETAIKGETLNVDHSLAKSNATILFFNNRSARGGAVATNGTVIIGEKDKEFDLKVLKSWDKKLDDIKNSDNTEVEIELYNVTNVLNPFLIDKIILNKANNYEATFSNLPLEANNQKITYKVVEKDDSKYNIIYKNNIITTENIVNGQEVVVDINNSLKEVPTPPTPTIPITPTTPLLPKTGVK